MLTEWYDERHIHYYQTVSHQTSNILLLSVFLLSSFLTASGIRLYITTLNVKYCDFRYIVPFIVQFGLYVFPVGFSSSIVPEKYRLLLFLESDDRSP
jgi:ABC-type polysaccharide/polyol phosphate export permease